MLALQLHIVLNSESTGLHGKEALDDGCIDRNDAGALGFLAARGEGAHARAVSEDQRGLRVVATIDNPDGGAAAAPKRGAVTGLSFGFRARSFTRDASGRELQAVDLFEVSLVTHPMQHGARVHLLA